MTLLPVTAMPVFAAEAASYTDTGTHWASSAIDKWSGLGVLQGYDGKFRPNDPITRGEMAVIIDRIIPKITQKQMTVETGLSLRTIERELKNLRDTGVIYSSHAFPFLFGQILMICHNNDNKSLIYV
jgi:DNA-binding transcriptional ArsR family regulator